MSHMRLGVIGVGALGQHHARILSQMDGVQLAGVVDSREQQGREIAGKCKTQWFAEASQLQPLVDGVVVAVPTVFHLETARPFLEAGIAVLVEKPLADNLNAAQALHRLADLRQAILQVGHVERFNPTFELVQQQVKQPLYIRCQRFSPYTFRSTDIGVVHDLMIHDIDLVLALTRDAVEKVDSFGAVTVGPHEDMAMARLRFRSGIIADITSSRMNPTAERSMQVWSPDGFVSADFQTRKVTTWKPSEAIASNPALIHEIVAATPNPLTLKDEVFSKWIQPSETQASSGDALTAELQDFVTCIRTGSQPRVTSKAAVSAMEVADRVLSGMTKWSWQEGSMRETAAIRKAA